MAREFPFRSNASATARGRKQRLGTGGLANADMTRGFRRGSGGGGGGGGSNSFSAVLTEILRDRAVYDSGFHRGLSAATVALSGTTNAPDGAIIEVRLVDVQTGGALYTTAWAPFDVAASGAFFGTLQVPRAPCWYRAEVRVQGSTAPAAQMANRFAAGHVWSIWEQSNIGRLVSAWPANYASLYDAVTHDYDVQISERGGLSAGSGGSFNYTVKFVAEATKGAVPITPAMVTLANAWSVFRPGEKLFIAFNVKTGSSFREAMSSAAETSDGRDFMEDLSIHQAAVAIGTQVGVAFVPGWIEAHIGFGSVVPENFLRSFTGHDSTGAKINIDTLWGGSSLPRIPAAVLASGDTVDSAGNVLNGPNGGLYDLRYTRVCWFGPHGNDVPISTALTNPWMHPAAYYSSTPLSGMPSYDTVPEAASMADIVKNSKTIWKASSFSEVMDYPGQHFGAMRKSADTLHMDGGDRDGRQRHAQLLMFYMTKALGMHSHAVPVLDGRRDDPAGAYTDLWSTGRNLTTERLRRQAAGTLGSIPATIPAIAPHRCEVMGCAIDKKPVLAEIKTASGHPVLPDGQTYCRVYALPGLPISAVSEVRYGFGPLPGYLVDEDYDDRVYLNWLVCDVGQPQAVLGAVPVQFQHRDGLPTTLAVPDLFKVSGATYMRSTSPAVPPGTTAYMEAEFRVDAFHAAGMELMGLGDDAFVIVNSNGSITFGGNGSTSATTPAGTLVQGVFRKLGFATDRTPVGSGGSPKLRIIDVAAGGTILAESTTVTTGNFSNSRVNFFFRGGSGNQPFNGTFKYVKTWQNTFVPSGNPAYSVEAAPASPHYAVPYGALQFTASWPNAPIDGTL